jgi:hypothetical protein
LESGSGYAARALAQISGIVAVSPPSFAHVKLFLLDLLCQLDATDYHRRRPQALQSQHRAQPLFDAPVILFDEVLARTSATRHYPSIPPPPGGRRRRRPG